MKTCDELPLYLIYEDKWSPEIRERGEEYYHNKKVDRIFKNKNQYFANVHGSGGKEYAVVIEVTNENINMGCSCPCDYPCKHEYAVLIAMESNNYEVVKLKPYIKKPDITLEALINKVPAELLKSYLLSPTGRNKVIFEELTFKDYFRNYMPAKNYEYYYNNLYNSLVIDRNYEEKVREYLTEVKQNINDSNFNKPFKIIKSIIEAYNDSDKLNYDDFITDLIPTIGMYLRIIYRNTDEQQKKKIKEWINHIKKNAYYNDYYLEDMILSVK